MELTFLCYEGIHRPSSRIRAYGFARALADRNYTTSVISIADRFGLEGEQAYRLKDVQKLFFNALILRDLIKKPDALFYLQKVGYHLLAPFLARWINANPLIVDYDDWDLQIQPFRALRLLGVSDIAKLTKQVFSAADIVVTASQYLYSMAQDFGIAQRKLRYLPTAADTDFFKPVAMSREAGGPVVFCWIGLIWNDEIFDGVRSIITAFATMRARSDCTLLIAGNYYHYRQRLEKLANSLPPNRNVTLVGWMQPDSVPHFLAGVDIGVFLLTRDNPYNRAKSPTKLFEYMAMGIPAIVGYHGEAMSVIRDGCSGCTVTDFSGLVAAMENLADNQLLRSEMGLNARRDAVTRYSLSRVVDSLEDIINSIQKGGAPSD